MRKSHIDQIKFSAYAKGQTLTLAERRTIIAQTFGRDISPNPFGSKIHNVFLNLFMHTVNEIVNLRFLPSYTNSYLLIWDFINSYIQLWVRREHRLCFSGITAFSEAKFKCMIVVDICYFTDTNAENWFQISD